MGGGHHCWCGSTNIQRCVEIGHLHQCRIHPEHYSRTPGKCIECKKEWERNERAQREQGRARKLEKHARDTGNKLMETVNKPSGHRQTQAPRASRIQKPGKWPMKHKQQLSGAQLAPEAEQTAMERQEQEKGKSMTQDPNLFKAKKKWKD